MKKIKLTIPATSANLGAGFDCLALALGLYNNFTAEQAIDKFYIINKGYQSSNIKDPEKNILITSYTKTCQQHNWQSPYLKLTIDAKIPIEAGLGASATAVVAGVALAYAFNDQKMDRNLILEDAYKIESHPDNIVAAIFGGFTVALINNGKCHLTKFLLRNELKFNIIKPRCKINTLESRSKLPLNVNMSAAANNIANASLFTAAMANAHYSMIKNCTQDNLHQPYRINKNFEYEKLIAKLQHENDFYGMTLSGSGPAFIIFCAQFSPGIKKIVHQHLNRIALKFDYFELLADNSGLRYQL